MNISTAQCPFAHSAERGSLPLGWTAIPLLMLVGLPGAAWADGKITLRTDGHVENSSNIFYLADGVPPPYGNGQQGRGDTYYAYGGGVNGSYNWRRQTLSVDLEAHDFRYDTYTQLNHDQFRVTGDYEWQLGSRTSGSLTVNRNRDMVAFTDLVGQEQLQIETNQNEHATLDFRVGRKWSLETGIGQSQSDSPRVGAPDLSLTEKAGEAAIRYLGGGGFSTGLSGLYSSGNYDNSGNTFNGKHHQFNVQWFTNYARSKESNLSFAVGYASRSSPNGIDNVSSTTGLLNYSRQLTAKTSVKLELSRDISSYISTRGAEIDTRGAVNINWQATRKILVSVSEGYNYSRLPEQGVSGDDRTDHYRRTELNVQYQATRLLAIQPYARLEHRTSDLPGGGYDAKAYGLYASLRWTSK